MRLFEGTEFDIPPRCERCEELESECKCPPPEPERLDPSKQTAKVSTEKRKRGKLVTLIEGLPSEGNDLQDILTKLKNKCGAGGTLKNNAIEIQGDHLDRVREVLREIGFRVK